MNSQSHDEVLAIAERLLSMAIDSRGNKKAQLTFLLGAGASREYGIPTTIEFARKFFESALFYEKREISPYAASEPEIDRFIREFRSQLDSDQAYAFFRDVEERSVEESQNTEILTYDRIVDLWRNGYVKLIITTNFDTLLEKRFEAYTVSTGAPDLRLAVLDYNDLAHTDRPQIIDARVLIKIAGQIDRSNMLWTEEEFREKLSPTVRRQLEIYISDTPLILLGYTASEPPLADLLSRHSLYAVSVLPTPREKITTLQTLADRRSAKFDHAETSASAFVEKLYERLYEKTNDSSLILSYRRLQDKVKRLSGLITDPYEPPVSVTRREYEARLQSFMGNTEPKSRLMCLIGESGTGKTTLLRKTAINNENVLSVQIPVAEITTSLNEWARRIDDITLDNLCHLTCTLDRTINVLVDGLNEGIDTPRMKAVVYDLIGLLDRYECPNVRAIITCRTDTWTMLGLQIERNYLAEPIKISGFSDNEFAEAMRQLKISSEEGTPRTDVLADMLRLPQNFAFAFYLGEQLANIGSEPALLEMVYETRTNAIRSHLSVLVWLCTEMRRSGEISLWAEDLNTSQRRMTGMHALTDAGFIHLNRFSIVRFREDRMGEFIFGCIYLHDHCWYERDRKLNHDPSPYWASLVEEYHNISTEAASYKSMFLSALTFFLYRCSEADFLSIYRDGDSFTRTLSRAAAVLKRELLFDSEYIDDPVMIAVCLLNDANNANIVRLIHDNEYRLFSGLPFGFGSKLFPDAFRKFLEFLVDHVRSTLTSEQFPRPLIYGLINSLLIFLLRNGPNAILGHFRLRKALVDLVSCVPSKYLASLATESLEENSRYLFHYHPSAKLSDILNISWHLREQCHAAISGSLHDLMTVDLVTMIKESPASRLVARLLIFRDSEDHRFPQTIERLFVTGDTRIQDFCMGALGFAGKINPSFIELSEGYLVRMRIEYPRNFFQTSLDHSEPILSQYDPLVPHVTTLFELGRPLNLNRLLPDRDARTGYRLGRLAQKTLLDFPSETLDFVSAYISDGGAIVEEIRSTLRVAARLFPAAYWKKMHQEHPYYLFEISGDDVNEIELLVSQVRDYDWSFTYRFMSETQERRALLSAILDSLITATDIESWVAQGIHWIRMAQHQQGDSSLC